MRIIASTNTGLKRENNQDAYETGEFPGGDVWAVVCDGMGGVSGGQIASSICVEKVSEGIKRSYRKGMTVNSVKNMLVSSINAANAAVFQKSIDTAGLKGMGTTIVAVVVLGNIGVVAHVGDSRAYLINDEIKPITKDHSYVQLLIDTGKITEEEARTHPDSNIITRAVGIENFVDVEIDIIDINENDSLLLCSDGLNGYVKDNVIFKTVNEFKDSSAEKLVEKANEAGGYDNVTVVLLAAEIQGE